MASTGTYRVRDGQGTVYGPADVEMLRQWIREGRVVAGMMLNREGETEWNEISNDLNFADLFGRVGGASAGGQADVGGAANTSGAQNPYREEYPVTRADPANYYGPSLQMNVLGLIGMIAGIASIPVCCCYGVPSMILGATAIVLSAISLKQFKNEPDRYSGKGMALAGLYCGIGGIILGLGFVGFVIYAIVNSK